MSAASIGKRSRVETELSCAAEADCVWVEDRWTPGNCAAILVNGQRKIIACGSLLISSDVRSLLQ